MSDIRPEKLVAERFERLETFANMLAAVVGFPGRIGRDPQVSAADGVSDIIVMSAGMMRATRLEGGSNE